MTDYGVTDQGFVIKPVEVILEELAARQRATIDPLWNTEADSLAGQYNGIFAEHLAQLWEVSQANYFALSRDADGNALDIIGALTGTARKAATKATVTLTLSLNASTTVPAGSIVSVDGDPSIRVVTTEEGVNSGGSPTTVDVEAEAESAGAITANPSTLTTIETPVAGWTAVTNASSLAGGTEIETDDVYRRRQLTELAAGGGGSVPGIRADLLAVSEDIIACVVLENDSDTEVDGMPPHSVEAIVHGGEGLEQEIAEALFNSKSGGIATYSSNDVPVVATVTDEQGIDHEVRFSRPVEVPIYMAVGVTTIGDWAGYVEPIQAAIDQASRDSTSPAYLGIGSDVYASRVLMTVLGIEGVIDARVALSLSTITDPTAGSLVLAIDDREIGAVSTVRISVSEL